MTVSTRGACAPATGRSPDWRLLGMLMALLLAMCGGMLMASPDVDGVRMTIRATARSSLLLFLLAYTAAPLRRLAPGGWSAWQLRHRRDFGLAFAFSHALHLAGIFAFATLDPLEFRRDTALANQLVGGLAYAFIFAMAFTSFDRTAAWIGARNWKRLHTVGLHYVWLVFLLSLGRRAIHDPDYAWGVALLLAALGLRLLARRRAALRGA